MRITRILPILLLLPAFVLHAQDSNAIPQEASADERIFQEPAPQVLVLDDVIREALEKNPEAQSAQHTINALQRRVP